MTSLHFVAVDLGGTQIRAARYTEDGVQLARVAMSTGPEDGTDSVLRRIRSAVRQVWPMEGDVAAVGIGVPGPTDYVRGILRFAPNIPSFKNIPMRDLMVEAFDVPVFLGNDADVAALAEHRYGAGQGVADMIYMTISTGVGGGMIFNNRLFTGGNGLGGEVGHMSMDINGIQCGCGNIGCLETLASGSAIARQARERISAGETSLLYDMVVGDLNRITGKLVFDAAQQNDALALSLFELAGTYLGTAIVSMMYLLNPSLFVLGGSVTLAGNLLFDPIHEVIASRAPKVYQDLTRVVPAMLGDDVGLWGALALCLMELDL